MRVLVLATALALLLPFAAACGEDTGASSDGAGGAGAQSGGAGGQGLTPQITPTSDAACPKSPPDSGESCARGDAASTCVYDGTDCQRFDVRCRSSVWTVLVVRETTCVPRACPDTAPSDGEACEESSISGTNDCRYNHPMCGESKRAICNGAKWSVVAASDNPGCQLTCPKAPPKVGSACVGYAPNGCRYDNECSQLYYAQCSGGLWVAQQGRETCTTSVCPDQLPVAGSSCIAFEQGIGCAFESSCEQQRVARCNIDKWIVSNPCGE